MPGTMLRTLQTLIHFNSQYPSKAGNVSHTTYYQSQNASEGEGVLLIITQESSCKPGCPEQSRPCGFYLFTVEETEALRGKQSTQGHQQRQVGKLSQSWCSQASRYISLRHLQLLSKAAILLSSPKSSFDLNIS